MNLRKYSSEKGIPFHLISGSEADEIKKKVKFFGDITKSKLNEWMRVHVNLQIEVNDRLALTSRLLRSFNEDRKAWEAAYYVQAKAVLEDEAGNIQAERNRITKDLIDAQTYYIDLGGDIPSKHELRQIGVQLEYIKETWQVLSEAVTTTKYSVVLIVKQSNTGLFNLQ